MSRSGFSQQCGAEQLARLTVLVTTVQTSTGAFPAAANGPALLVKHHLNRSFLRNSTEAPDFCFLTLKSCNSAPLTPSQPSPLSLLPPPRRSSFWVTCCCHLTRNGRGLEGRAHVKARCMRQTADSCCFLFFKPTYLQSLIRLLDFLSAPPTAHTHSHIHTQVCSYLE